MNAECTLLPESTRMWIRDAFKLNAWAGVAVNAAGVSRMWHISSELTGGLRVGVVLLPLLPGLLHVRSIWRQMQGLDELQRRLQLEAVCFAALGMLLIALTADLLRMAGSTARLNFGWEGYFAFTFFLYALGLARANRRYL